MKFARFLILFFAVPAFAQKQAAIDEYIAAYRQFAIDEQVRTGIPAAITMAQAIHESGAGQGDLALKSNNHFGIKCKNTWTGDVVFHDDDSAGECFRSYTSVADSYRDHSDFLRNGKRYAFLFDIPPTDYNGWATGLKQAGYATNPRYTAIITRIIEDNELQSLTETALVQSGNTIWLTAQNTAANTSLDKSNNGKTTSGGQVFNKPAGESAAPRYEVVTINRCKAVKVPAGTLIRKIAVIFDVDYTDLINFNDMKPVEKVTGSQILFLEEKRRKGDDKTHKVQKGETLWTISQTEGIRLERLLEYNDLPASAKLKAGKILKLR